MSLRISGRALRAAFIIAAMGCFLFTATAASAARVEVTPLGAIGTKAAKGKKKCKKKAKKGSAAAKKKCKKKKKKAQPKPPAATPTVRASLTFNGAVEVDLHAYDASGLHAGWEPVPPAGGVVQGIPNAAHSGDVSGPGVERFTDNAFVNGGANREFAYLICQYGTSSSSITITFGDGVSETLALPTSAGAYSATYTGSGGPPLPPTASCPV
jgi:hypothetical protein